jgi:hypothetical protein
MEEEFIYTTQKACRLSARRTTSFLVGTHPAHVHLRALSRLYLSSLLGTTGRRDSACTMIRRLPAVVH